MSPFGILINYISEFRRKSWVATATLTCVSVASGCVNSTVVRRQETAVLERYEKNSPSQNCANATSNDNSYVNRVCFAADLARTYISLADQASEAEELAAYGTIAAAGTAAGALAYGANLEVLKGAGLAAGTIAVSKNYAQQVSTATHLLDAADGLLCIAKVGRTSTLKDIPDAAELIDDSIDTIRIDLRRKLARQSPDYQTILALMKSTSTASNSFVIGAPKNASDLRTELDTCVLKSIRGNS